MIYCLCNHSVERHGLTAEDVEGGGKVPGVCEYCGCGVFEEDPTYEIQSRVDAAGDWARDEAALEGMA